MSLSPEARSSITRAVEAAESVCGAEVVVVGYVRADGYLDTAFRNALVGALLALALVLMVPVEVHHDLVFPIVAVTAVGLFWLTRLTAVAGSRDGHLLVSARLLRTLVLTDAEGWSQGIVEFRLRSRAV